MNRFSKKHDRLLAPFNVQKKQLPSQWPPEANRKPDGCDFSELVRKFKPDELEINCGNIHEVKIGKLLGSGGSRKVYEGEFHGRKVALKDSRVKSMRKITMITEEAALHFQLNGAPNIIPLLGWCNTTIVLDKAAGTLSELIMNKMLEISVESALKMALDIAKGLQQLH